MGWQGLTILGSGGACTWNQALSTGVGWPACAAPLYGSKAPSACALPTICLGCHGAPSSNCCTSWAPRASAPTYSGNMLTPRAPPRCPLLITVSTELALPCQVRRRAEPGAQWELGARGPYEEGVGAGPSGFRSLRQRGSRGWLVPSSLLQLMFEGVRAAWLTWTSPWMPSLSIRAPAIRVSPWPSSSLSLPHHLPREEGVAQGP